MSILFILDSSIHTQPFVEPYMKCIETVLNERRKIKDTTPVSIATFAERNDLRNINIPLHLLPPPKIEPNGNRAFCDSVCALLIRYQKFVEAVKIRNIHYVVIFSSGREDASRLTGPKELFYQILQHKMFGWKFIFVGQDDISIKIAQACGFNVRIKYSPNEDSLNKVSLVLLDVLRDGLDDLTKPFQDFTTDVSS
jgi:hypothetical protein